jgi:hypothetical protein
MSFFLRILGVFLFFCLVTSVMWFGAWLNSKNDLYALVFFGVLASAWIAFICQPRPSRRNRRR